MTRANDTSRIWHGIFGHLNFNYLQEIHNEEIVKGFPLIMSSGDVCNGCLVGKHPKRRYEVGKERRVSFALDMVYSDVYKCNIQNFDLTLIGISSIACDVDLMLYFVYWA